MTKVGLNAGFGDLLSSQDLRDVESMGAQIVRSEINPGHTDDEVRALLAQHVGKPRTLLVILEGGIGVNLNAYRMAQHGLRLTNIAREVGIAPWIELGNEPDLGASANYPRLYGDLCAYVYDALRSEGWLGPIISAGLSSDGGRWMRYLRGMDWSRLPAELIVGLHRYPVRNDPDAPFKQFSSRDAEIDAVRRLTGNRPIAFTEGGYTTERMVEKTGWLWWKRTVDYTINDSQAAERMRYEFAFWRRQGALCYCWYQLNDGPVGTGESGYGLRRTDGTWKPQAFALRSLARG